MVFATVSDSGWSIPSFGMHASSHSVSVYRDIFVMRCLFWLGCIVLLVILMPNFLSNFICVWPAPVSWMLIVQSCYPQVLLGQVMHRLKLTWLGSEGNHPDRSMKTFTTLAIIAAVHVCTMWVTYFTLLYLLISGLLRQSESEIETSQDFANLCSFLNLVFFVFLVVIMARTRRSIRSRYGIPEQTCCGCEDCCCAYWCSCCTVSQMARHTADYDNYPALCCSETGLLPNAPSIVWRRVFVLRYDIPALLHCLEGHSPLKLSNSCWKGFLKIGTVTARMFLQSKFILTLFALFYLIYLNTFSTKIRCPPAAYLVITPWNMILLRCCDEQSPWSIHYNRLLL